MLMSTELPCGIKMNSCSYVLDLLTRDPLHLLKGWASGWSRPSHLLMCQPVSLLLWQRFSIPVLAPPRSAYFACLSLLTHLIQIISLLEVRSMHELCSDWYAPYTGSIAPYSLSDWNWEPLSYGVWRPPRPIYQELLSKRFVIWQVGPHRTHSSDFILWIWMSECCSLDFTPDRHSSLWWGYINVPLKRQNPRNRVPLKGNVRLRL